MTTPFVASAKRYFQRFPSHFCLICNYLGAATTWFAIFLFTANLVISLIDVFSIRGSEIIIVMLILSYLMRQLTVGLGASILQIILFFVASLVEHMLSTLVAIKVSCVFIIAGLALLVASISHRGITFSLKLITQLIYDSCLMMTATLAFRFNMLHDLHMQIFEPKAAEIDEKNRERYEENHEDIPNQK